MSFEMDTLDHIIYGKAAADAPVVAMAMSGTLTAEDAAVWQGIVAVEPFMDQDDSVAAGVFSGSNKDLILARAWRQNGGIESNLYQLIRLPRTVYQMMGGNVSTLITELAPVATPSDDNTPLEPLRVPPVPTWTTDKRTLLFNRMVEDYSDGSMTPLFMMLGAALHERRLLIRNYPANLSKRLDLIQTLLLLLPSPARAEMTFSTNIAGSGVTTRALVVFSDADLDTDRWVADFNALHTLDDDALLSPYVRGLTMLWQDDVSAFVGALRGMELLSVRLMDDKNLSDGLSAIANRIRLDTQVAAGEEIPISALKSVMTGVEPHTEDLQKGYAEQLLSAALRERDVESVNILQSLMHRNATVDTLIVDHLQKLLVDEPDAVYFFLRTYLAEDVDERMLPLLQSAAIVSLQVVLTDGDVEMIMTWLKLIAREPASFQLGEALRDGILSAQALTYSDGVLGRRMLSFTARRAPDVLDILLDDNDLIAALEAPVGPALRNFDPDAVVATVESGKELALILYAWALKEAADRPEAAAVFDPDQIETLWSLSLEEDFSTLSDTYQPHRIIDTLIATSGSWIAPASVTVLIKRAAMDDNRAQLVRICTLLTAAEDRKSHILAAMRASALPPSHVLTTTKYLLDQEVINGQSYVDVLIGLAGDASWTQEQSLPYIEQVSRVLNQNQLLVVSFDLLQRMMSVVSEARSEVAVRTLLRRLLMALQAMDDETQLFEQLIAVNKQLSWSTTARTQILTWWRGYARTQSLTRLQQLEKLLDGRKGLESLRSVVRTAIAMRKMMGKRSLEEFADAISMAYTILQSFADSFDVSRQTLAFDQPTVRAEFEARETELTPDERSVLAKNLKELADLITEMADNRSKATLIRREEDIERQLLAGDQEPHSAIDTMRWLSGYLSGMQSDKG